MLVLCGCLPLAAGPTQTWSTVHMVDDRVGRLRVDANVRATDPGSSEVEFWLAIRAFEMGTLVVSAHGDVDLVTAAELETELLETVRDGARRVIVDLTEATFVESSAIHALLRAGQRLQWRGRELAVVCGNPTVKRVLDITGVDRVLPVHTTIEQAVGLPGLGRPARPGPATLNLLAVAGDA